MSVNKLIKLAEKFEYKIKKVSQIVDSGSNIEKPITPELELKFINLYQTLDNCINATGEKILTFFNENSINIVKPFPPQTNMPNQVLEDLKNMSYDLKLFVSNKKVKQSQLLAVHMTWNEYPYKGYLRGWFKGSVNSQMIDLRKSLGM